MIKYLFSFAVLSGLHITHSHAQNNVMKHNDTAVIFKLQEVKVTEGRNWDNDETRYKYNQMKHYIKSILPYLDEATVLFKDMDAKINDPAVSKRERKAYVNSKEDELRLRFDDEIKKLNETQGVLLVKLIGRQTGVNIYNMLSEFKNPLTAIKWQTWAKFNGMNINRRYVPEEEPMLEHIMESLGYPLPPLYGERNISTLKNSDVYYQ